MTTADTLTVTPSIGDGVPIAMIAEYLTDRTAVERRSLLTRLDMDCLLAALGIEQDTQKRPEVIAEIESCIEGRTAAVLGRTITRGPGIAAPKQKENWVPPSTAAKVPTEKVKTKTAAPKPKKATPKKAPPKKSAPAKAAKVAPAKAAPEKSEAPAKPAKTRWGMKNGVWSKL